MPDRRPPTGNPPSLATRRAQPRRVWLIVAAFGLVVVAAGGALAWRQHLRAERVASLPTGPDLSGRPAELRERIAEARARYASGSRDALAELASLYHANGLLAEAETCWRRLSESEPRQARWRYYLADLARAQADEAAFLQRLQETLDREPDYSPAWLELGDYDFKRGNPAGAERAYRERLRLTPDDPHARLGLARLTLQQGRRAEAEQAIAQIIRDAPDFPSARNVYAELLAAGGDEAAAAAQRWLGSSAGRFREADDAWLLDLRPYCYDSYQLTVWGSQEEQTKHPERARALFERAIALAPADPLPYAELGQMLLDSGRRAEAREILERASQRAPFDEKVQLRLSIALRELGQAQAALENDERALAQSPGSSEFLNSLGQSQTALGRFAEAEQSFLESLRRSSNSASTSANLGTLYLKMGRREQARRTLESALERHPGYPKLLVSLGGIALEDHRLEDAERYIRPYFSQYPGNATARTLFTQLHLGRATDALAAKDLAAAERWCTTGLAEVADAPELLGLLGSIHLQSRNVPAALAAMEACQRLRPGDPRAVLPLAMLYRELQRPADARRVLLAARDWLLQHNAAEQARQLDAMLAGLPAP